MAARSLSEAGEKKKRVDWLRFNLLSLFAARKALKMETADERLVEITITLIELIKMQDKCRLCVFNNAERSRQADKQ